MTELVVSAAVAELAPLDSGIAAVPVVLFS